MQGKQKDPPAYSYVINVEKVSDLTWVVVLHAFDSSAQESESMDLCDFLVFRVSSKLHRETLTQNQKEKKTDLIKLKKRHIMGTHLDKDRAGRGRLIKNDNISEVLKLMEMSTCHGFRSRGQANISTRDCFLKNTTLLQHQKRKKLSTQKELFIPYEYNILVQKTLIKEHEKYHPGG